MYNLYTSTITSKGQVTIPAPFRKKLGIKPGQKISFRENGKGIILKSHSQMVDELYGSLKTHIKWNEKKAYQAVGEMLAQRYIKTLPRKLHPKFNEIT